MYAQTAGLFADEIRRRIPSDRGSPLIIADIGAFQGELLSAILAKLPEHDIETIEIDRDSVALQRGANKGNKMVGLAETLPFGDATVDVAIMRYVLQWNSAETQKRILAELARAVKEFALIEHAGADIVDTDEWRAVLTTLLSTDDLAKLKRSDCFFSSRDEVETWLQEAGVSFERLQDRVIGNLADVFTERYALNPMEAQRTREILGDKNYIRQTDWVIFPKP